MNKSYCNAAKCTWKLMNGKNTMQKAISVELHVNYQDK